MTTLPLPVSTAAATATDWAADVGRALGRDTETGLRVLRGTLHVLHEVLDPPAAGALSDGLPTVLRGMYHAPAPSHAALDTRDGFLAAVSRATRRAVRPEEAARAVWAALARRLPAEVWATVRAGVPPDVRPLLALPPRPDR